MTIPTQHAPLASDPKEKPESSLLQENIWKNCKAENPRQMEMYSSAISLSDMEIFIFPDLMYALVLANIMSPEIWKWRDDAWFKNIEKKSFSYKINRIKQYVMDHFVFNLDLETWGLTTKEKELARFSDFVDPKALARSNALFGYEGDKYYYDVDIRRHFGLDQYNTNVIPYWKTETIEAMKAFSYKEGYTVGAGECVSLSALYIAALFIVGRIPLDNMFMIATPLHSQNFIAEKDGFLTNNRRVVTKKMWYNGTELSAKARRSIENEQITIVSHISGIIHTFYKEASIDPNAYRYFQEKFNHYLEAELSFEYFSNFLYSREPYWNCFQYRHIRNGKECFISLSCLFNTQRTSKNRFDNESRQALIEEMDSQCFALVPMEGKIIINDIEEFLQEKPQCSFEEFAGYLTHTIMPESCCATAGKFLSELKAFLKTEPRMPRAEEKTFSHYPILDINVQQDRETICRYIYQQAAQNHPVAVLSLYVRRDMEMIDWNPFLKAAMERNPVCIKESRELSDQEMINKIVSFTNASIYDGKRMAQPDEVWNFQRGDGAEKVILLANLFHERYPDARIGIRIGQDCTLWIRHNDTFAEMAHFSSSKSLTKAIEMEGSPLKFNFL